MTTTRNVSVFQKLFGVQKSRGAKQNATKGRLLRMEALEERSLLTALIGVVATDARALESLASDVGNWRIERAESASSPLPVSFKLSGTATWDVDYRIYNLSTSTYLTPTSVYNQELGEYELIGEATIASGSTLVDLELRAISDTLQEPTEFSTLTLLASSAYNILGGAASIEIVDGNSWYVDVSATDPVASEAPSASPDYATFTVTRNGLTNLSTALTVRFEVGGSATPNSDYSLYNANSQNISLSQSGGSSTYFGYVQIPAGQTTTTIQLRPNNDSIWEPTETTTIEVVSNPSYFYNVGNNSFATATIIDNDAWTLNIAALDAEGAETASGAPSNPLVFRISRVGETDLSTSTTVWFGLNGSASFSADYNLSGASYNSSYGYGTITIPANATYADLTLNVVDDALLESTETVGVFLMNKPVGAYGSDYLLGADFLATGTILDDDGWTINVAATDPLGSETISGEPADPIVFTLTRSGETNLSKPTTVYFRLSGAASFPTSYYWSDYSISGANYDANYNYGTATIPANATSTTITISPYNDSYYEETESVVFTILKQSPIGLSPPLSFQYAVGEMRTAVGMIADNDNWTVNVEATDGEGAETVSGAPENPIVFTFTRSGATDLAQATTVYYELTGAATPGTDYSVANGSLSSSYGYVTIPANATSTTLTLNVVDDYLIEDNESVILSVLDFVPDAFSYYGSGVQYALGSSSVANAFIADNENRIVVEIVALDPLARETPSGQPTDGGTFRISRTGGTSSDITVNYTTSGTATNGSDYSNLYGSVTIPSGASYVDVAVTPYDDSEKEAIETLVVTLSAPSYYGYYYGPSASYVLGPASSATVFILDDDLDPTGGPYVVPENGSAALSAFASLESAGWTIDWDLDGDGVYGETGAGATRGAEAGADAAFSASGITATDPPQTYALSVRASNGGTTYIASTSATIQNVAPQISLTGPASVAPGASAAFSGSFVDPGADVWTGTILFGDEAPGATPAPLTLNTSNKTFSTSHTYSTSGWFDAVVSINDGKETSTTSRRVKVGSPAAVEFSLEGSDTPLVSGASVALKSFEKDANGANLDPQTGETVFQRFRVRNLGAEPLSIDASAISLPTNVALVGSFPSSLVPDETQILTVKWTAREALAGTISIPTSDPVVPTFNVALTGSVTAYAGPTLDAVSLLYDSGASSTDKITFNPILTGTVSGNFARGRVDVEFDVDADSVTDGVSTLYVSGQSFKFDPRTASPSWPRPATGSADVSVRYRLVHYDDLGTVLSTGAWNAFNYTVVPEPVGTLTVSNLSVSAGWDGDWTQPGSVVLNGSLSGSGTRQVEIVAGSNRVVQTVSTSSFSISLPFGFEYGNATTVQARVGAYDSTCKIDVYGAWTSLSVTPQLPDVSYLTFQTYYENGPELVGTLANGVGRNYREVVFSCGSDILGSAWTDENGSFTFVPKGLPIVNGVATGTVTARAVHRPTTGSPIYGASASTSVSYSPESIYAYLTISLAEPGETSTPAFKVSGSFPSKYDVAFEYRWKLSSGSDWSTPKFLFGSLDDERNVDEEATNLYWNGAFSIPELYDVASPSAGVQIEARPLVYNEIFGDYVASSSWSSFSTTFVRPTFSVASISSAALANPTDGIGSVSSDPTISGTISSSGELGGIAIKFYLGDVCVGQTTTDSDGSFSFTPSGLSVGQVQLSVVASQWNPTSREYQTGTPQTVSFEYAESAVTAPSLETLELADDTGVVGDGVTANVMIRGRLDDSDGQSVVNLLVEYDVDGDGMPDGWTRSDGLGEFYFAPTLTQGSHIVRARAMRWNSVAGTEIVGAWRSVSVTYATPTNPAAPEIRQLGPSTYLLNAQGQQTTYSSRVFGRASSETGFDDVRVEYEILSGGSGTHTANVSPLGEFCWEPTLTVSDSGETNVSLRSRVGRWDAATNTTVWGAWTTSSFVYRAATESVLLAWKNDATDRPGANYNERKFSGSVAPGEGVLSYYVEFDLDGDGTADGQTAPNSNNDFVYYAEPTQSEIYARVVDKLADGTTRVSEQSWQTIATSYYNNYSSELEKSLDLYFVDDVDYVPYLHIGNYSGTSSNVTISLDYNYDGTVDATVSPDLLGQISSSAITAALENADVEIRDGFSVVYAWINDSTTNKTLKVPVPLLTSEEPSEIARFDSFIASMTTILDYDPTQEPGSTGSDSSTQRPFDYQTTPEPASSSTTRSLNVGAQSDWDVLNNTPIPEIAFPTLDGEGVDLSKDVELQQTFDEISNAYDAAVRAARDAWSSTYQNLRGAHELALDSAWNVYSCAFSRINAEYAELQELTWEGSDKYQEIQTTYQEEYNAIYARRAEKTAEIDAWYSEESDAIMSYYYAHRFDAHDPVACYSQHTPDCQSWQIEEEKRRYNDDLCLGVLTSQKRFALNAETQLLTAQAEARHDSALSEAQKTFELNRNARLAELAQSAAEIGKNYEISVANAIYDFYAGSSSGGLAGADEAYRNAIASALQTATTEAWSAVRSAVTAWKNAASTPVDWGNYVDALYALAQTEELARAGASAAQALASASAARTADVAAANAYREYLTTNATSICVAECGNVLNAQALQNAVVTATAAKKTAITELESSELVSQIETSLSTRLGRMDAFAEHGVATGSLFASLSHSLIGVTNQTVREELIHENEMALNSLWKPEAFERFVDEEALYNYLIDSGAAIESGTYELNRDFQNAQWSALGTYWKAEIATSTALSISTENAKSAYWTAVNTAGKTFALAQISAESNCVSAKITASQNRLNGEKALMQTTLQNLFGSYFTSLITACGNMAKAFVGNYYASVVSAIQTAFNAQNTADSNLETSLISKATDYATTTLNLDAAYATSYVNAAHDYFATQNVSTEDAQNRKKISDQAEIDARITYYQARENANCAKNVTVVQTNADESHRKLHFLKAWSDYVTEVAWRIDPLEYDYGAYQHVWGPPYETSLPTTSTASPAFGLWSSDGIPNSFGGVYLDSSSSWVTYDASSIWNDFNSLNSAIVSMQAKNAELQCEAGVASALSAYVTAYTTNYDAEARAAIDDAGAKLTSDLNAETTLNNAFWNARETAHSGYMTAISVADSTQSVLDYVDARVASSIAYKSARANAYGDFQIANRQNKLDGTTASNPRRGAYQSDVAWAQQTKSLRNQYRIASGTATSDYYTTVANALTAYNTAALNAELTAAQNYFNAEKAYSQNVQGAYVGYALADFAAAKAQALAYLTASTTQLIADYGKEAELAQSRASAYSLLLNNLQAALDAADLTKFGTISTLKETFVHALATANDADDALADANATQLAAEKAQNETNYNEALAEADATYQRAWQNAWNDAFLDVLNETAVEKTTFDAIINAMKTALGTAGNSYRDTIFAAYEDLSNEASNVAKIYAYNQSRIDQGGTVASNAFENPTADYEVCFVAGTQVLMADGTTKPIEQIRPDDMILAADHLNPEEEPTAASVVRFFDNGEKDVVKLVFEHAQEIVCTPTHRFYVIGKGWVHAQDLQSEDLCLSEKGEKIAFVARENLEEKQRVYNFEVEKKHTYFVGVNSKMHILTHNECKGTIVIWIDTTTLPGPKDTERQFDIEKVRSNIQSIFSDGAPSIKVLVRDIAETYDGEGYDGNKLGLSELNKETNSREYHFLIKFDNIRHGKAPGEARVNEAEIYTVQVAHHLEILYPGFTDNPNPEILAITYANLIVHEACWHGLLEKKFHFFAKKTGKLNSPIGATSSLIDISDFRKKLERKMTLK